MLSTNRTILYVDDDPDDRELLSAVLTELSPDINILEAENGLAGLLMLRKAQEEGKLPCVIVLDINMPLLDGKQMLVRILEDEHFKRVPVLMYTSSRNPQDKVFFDDQGVPLLHKPDNITFLRKIGSCILSYCS